MADMADNSGNHDMKLFINKQFHIDWDKIKTLEDVLAVLKAMQFVVDWYQEECPPQFREIYEKGFLKEQ